MPTGANTFLTDAQNNVATVAPLGNVYTNESFPILMASYHQSMTGASGGTNLPNVPCGKIELQNLSGNAVMWIGGVGQSAPYSGRGFELYGLDTVAGAAGKTMYVNNANQISVCARFSGQLISFMAYGNATTTVISPTTQGTAPNETVPTLVSTTPVSGSTNNSFITPITLTFNEALDPNNISGIYVVTSGQTQPSLLGHLGGVLTYLSGALTATFQANSGQFQLSGWYVPMVDASVDGFNGVNFGTTASGGPFQIQGPPVVSGWSPLSGTTGVSGGQQILVTFSQSMRSGTINISGIFLLSSGTSSPHISGTVNLLAPNSGNQAVFTPASGVIDLSGISTSTWYIPIANTNVKDVYGNPLALTSGFPFETAAAQAPPDTTPPNVSGTTPVSGATNVLVIPLPAIQITMSEAVNSGFITTNTVKIHDIQTSDVNVPGTVSLQSDLLTINWKPNSPLGNLDLHRMELSGIQDLAGNFMTPFSGATFTVEPILQVSGSTPASGDSSVVQSVTPRFTMDRAVLSGTVNTNTVVLVDQNSNPVPLASVSLANDTITVAFKSTNPLGYLVNYTYEISGIVDINNQQFMSPFSGASFNIIAPPLTQVYSVVGSNPEPFGPGNNSPDNTSAMGEQVITNSSPLFGRVLKQVQFDISRTGTPHGPDVKACIQAANGTIQTVFGTIPTTSLSTSQTTYTFTNTSASYSLATSDKVVILYSGAIFDNSSSYITMYYNNGSAYTSTQLVIYFNGTTGHGYTTEPDDVVASFWYG